jgi:hypothetical protein
MKKIALIFVLMPVLSFSQLNDAKTMLYAGFKYTNPYAGLHQISPIAGIYLKDKKNNLNNFEIHNFNFTRTPGSANTTFNLAYHKMIMLNKKSESRFQFGVGFGGSLFYNRYRRTPIYSSQFETKSTSTGITYSLKPLVNYRITDKLFIGFSPLFRFAETYLTFSEYKNPALPENQQKVTTMNFNTINPLRLNLNFNIGIRL